MARAVKHVHEHGIVHRGIAMRSFVLSSEYEPVLTDFGQARLLHGVRCRGHPPLASALFFISLMYMCSVTRREVTFGNEQLFEFR